MPLPASIARFNKRWTNRLIEPLIGRFPGFVTVHHVGRRSGTCYATPLYAFNVSPTNSVVIALTYGPTADWLLNVQAGPACLQTGTTSRPIVSASVIDHSEASASMPLAARLATRYLRIRHFALLETGP